MRVSRSRSRGRVLLGTLLLSGFLAGGARAGEPSEALQPEASEALELEALLKQETEIATKTRLNHDYVPGMVTILAGDDLELLGFQTVWEALSMVPGVQTVRDAYASPLLLVRGINFIFNSGNIKILVDSIPLNQESAGINSSILMMPVQEVERIEFMRGPGSAVHGDFAYMGLVNIITRRQGGRIYASGTSEQITAGAHASFPDPAAKTRIGGGLSGFWNQDLDGDGPTEVDEKRGFGRFFLASGGFSLALQAVEANHLTTSGNHGERYTERRLAGEARYAHDFSSSVNGEVHASFLANDDSVGPKGYEGQGFQGGFDLRFRAPGRHNLLLAVTHTVSEFDEASLDLPPLFDFTVSGIRRHLTSVALQDQWEIGSQLTVTGGLRVDHFSDIGTELTPRLALVFKLGEHQILKTQYAEGFRSPGFWELYGTGEALPGLTAETIATTELSYILKKSGFVGRATVFTSDLRDMVQPPFTPGGSFTNGASATTRGVEAEWTQHFGRALELMANVSWVDPSDNRATRDVLAASEWLWNLAVIAEPTSRLKLAARWNHTGTRGGFDSLPAIPGYDILDITATAPDLLPGLTVRAGVKNVLDDTVNYITTLPPPLDPVLQQYGGRRFWAELSYRF